MTGWAVTLAAWACYLVPGALLGGVIGYALGRLRELTDRVEALEAEAADPHGVGHLIEGGEDEYGVQ